MCSLLKGDNCIVGSTGCAVLSRGEDWERFLSGDTFLTELAAEALRSRRHNAAQHPETCALGFDDQAKRLFVHICKEVSVKNFNCAKLHARLSQAKEPRRTVHAAVCKFGLKRTAGSLCARGSDRLAEASRRSVRC